MLTVSLYSNLKRLKPSTVRIILRIVHQTYIFRKHIKMILLQLKLLVNQFIGECRTFSSELSCRTPRWGSYNNGGFLFYILGVKPKPEPQHGLLISAITQRPERFPQLGIFLFLALFTHYTVSPRIGIFIFSFTIYIFLTIFPAIVYLKKTLCVHYV